MRRLPRVAILAASMFVALGVAPVLAADVAMRVDVTNGGKPAADHARYELHPAGQHDGPVIGWAGAGQVLKAPAGSYDVKIIFDDGAAHRRLWLDRQSIADGYAKSVDVNLPVASVAYHLTNGGKPIESTARVELHVAGDHSDPVIAWASSDQAMRVPAGGYDVLAIFEDGAARRNVWFDGQSFTGTVKQAFDFGVAVASVTYHLTNGGKPDDGKGRVELHVAGNHSDPVVAWAPSDREMRVPAGRYDVLAIFEDGAAHRSFWTDGLDFAGKVDETLEVGAAVADVTYRLSNAGADLAGAARVELHPAGGHGAPVVAWAGSGGHVRVPAGRYDVAAIVSKGFVNETKWIDGQEFDGTVAKSFDFGLKLAEPVAVATLKGADLGDKARVTYYRAGSDAILSTMSGTPCLWAA